GLLAGVPELVRRPGRHRQALARPGDDLLASDAEPDTAAEHLEALLLRGMDVRRRHEAVRLHVGLDHDGLAAGLAGGLAEHEPLARDRILDAVPCANHLVSFSVGAVAGDDRRRRLRSA